ncbi:hypothetical protein AB0P36_10955 [Streptomyces flavidovirens]|uniref:M50 family metallopeptidase n=1 Tax=Streptomyces flavidovirens TaxID=67298 RepID=UPI00341E0B99
MSHLLRLVAEHEAAHAVVAATCGAHVHQVWVNARGEGRTIHSGTGSDRDAAAITAAGDVWNRHLGTVPYRDLACLDLKTFEREHGLRKLWHANQVARRILAAERQLVLDLADRLINEGAIVFQDQPAA